jgi:hypothetical protein
MIKIIWPWLFKAILRGYSGISLMGLMIFKSEPSKEDLNHEKIHFIQQLELLFVFFFLLYGVFYLRNRIRGDSHWVAYKLTPFEFEAFCNQGDLNYLKNRKMYAWLWVKFSNIKK